MQEVGHIERLLACEELEGETGDIYRMLDEIQTGAYRCLAGGLEGHVCKETTRWNQEGDGGVTWQLVTGVEVWPLALGLRSNLHTESARVCILYTSVTASVRLMHTRGVTVQKKDLFQYVPQFSNHGLVHGFLFLLNSGLLNKLWISL